MSETIGDVLEAGTQLRRSVTNYDDKRLVAAYVDRLRESARTAPERVLDGKNRIMDDDLNDPEWLAALRAELGV